VIDADSPELARYVTTAEKACRSCVRSCSPSRSRSPCPRARRPAPTPTTTCRRVARAAAT